MNLDITTIKLGDTVGGLIYGSIEVVGKVDSFLKHKGKLGIGLIDTDGHPRFLFFTQIEEYIQAYKMGLIEEQA